MAQQANPILTSSQPIPRITRFVDRVQRFPWLVPGTSREQVLVQSILAKAFYPYAVGSYRTYLIPDGKIKAPFSYIATLPGRAIRRILSAGPTQYA